MARPGKNRSGRSWNPVDWFNNVTDYFEWMFHQFTTGVVTVFTSIGSIVFPRRLIDSMRKKSSERAAQRALGTADKTTVEKLEDGFSSVSGGIGSVFSNIYKLFVPTKLIESTEKAVSTKTASVFLRLQNLAERLSPKWLTNLATRLSELLSPLTKFFSAWASTRDFKKLAWSLPAMLLALPIAGSFVGNIVYSSEDRMRHYNAKLTEAIDERDEKSEQLYFEKLKQLGYERTEQVSYTSAMSMIDEGNTDAGVAKMQEIAPLEEAGFPPAHIYLATMVADGRLQVDDAWKAFETHSRHAKSGSVGPYRFIRDTARRYLIEADLHYGRTEEAVSEMKELVANFPSLHGSLMDHHLRQSETDSAVRHARNATRYFESVHPISQDSPVTKQDPANAVELTTKEFMQWMTAASLTGRLADIPKIIDVAIKHFPDDEGLRNRLTAQLVGIIPRLPFSDNAMMGLLQKSQELEPDHPVVIRRFFDALSSRQDPAAQQCLESLELEGRAPVELLVRLGDDSVRKRQSRQAISYYKRALALDTEQVHAWNNMAYALSEFDPKDYELALKSVNRAIQIEPQNSLLYETRGQIFVGLKRWNEAIADLEKSLNGSIPNPVPTHLSLAKAYEAIGNKEQASAHLRHGGG